MALTEVTCTFETWEYMNQGENAYNVGCMLYGYGPVRLNEIVKANRTM